MVNTSQQVGGAIGTALLNTIAACATTAYVTDHIARPRPRRPSSSWSSSRAMVHGYTTAIWWAVGILVLAAVIAFTLINAGRPDMTATAPERATRPRTSCAGPGDRPLTADGTGSPTDPRTYAVVGTTSYVRPGSAPAP